MLLSALAALLLSGPPAALAQDPPPAGQFDARDTDQDGTVSGKERRRARRADRRARRGEKNADGTAAVDEEQDAADADASAERGQAATSAAANAAAALKSSMPSLDAAAMPGGDGGKIPGGAGGTGPGAGAGKTAASDFHGSGAAGTGSGSFKPSSFSAGASGDPSKPKSPSDFVLAARSGYAPAFAKTGLKLSADGRSVVRADGSPATADDYARLQREIGSMPGALSRRADFFNAISPGHYADLKRDYKTKKDSPAFKDVGETEGERDFVHTSSCDKLSGGCNANVEKGSYKKGDYVAPEDLDAIWGALQKQIDGSEAAGGNMSLSEQSSAIAREKAVEAAAALTDDPGGPGGLPKKKEGSTSSTTGGSSPAAVTQAVVTAQKFFASVTGLALPGRDPKTGEGGNPLPLIVAGSLAALGLGVLILRRKG